MRNLHTAQVHRYHPKENKLIREGASHRGHNCRGIFSQGLQQNFGLSPTSDRVYNRISRRFIRQHLQFSKQQIDENTPPY